VEGRNSLDQIDRSILRILSYYEKLTALQLWYELGEDDTVKKRLTEEEILGRLESLTAGGFLERLTDPNTVSNRPALLIFRIK